MFACSCDNVIIMYTYFYFYLYNNTKKCVKNKKPYNIVIGIKTKTLWHYFLIIDLYHSALVLVTFSILYLSFTKSWRFFWRRFTYSGLLASLIIAFLHSLCFFCGSIKIQLPSSSISPPFLNLLRLASQIPQLYVQILAHTH